jgi:hypothetical protein
MNRREMMMFSGMALAQPPAKAQGGGSSSEKPATPGSPETLLLKDYHPQSIYKTPQTEIQKAKYSVIDVHCHGAHPIEQLDEMVKLMDAVGVEKTVIFTGASTPERFAEMRKPYDKYPGRFDLWCVFDLAGNDQPGFGPAAVKALEECHRAGARGVGEIVDKGRGFGARGPGGRFPGGRGSAGGPGNPPPDSNPNAMGPHADDPRLDPLFDKCAQFGMPINIHVADPIWSYEPMDNTNDGLMNAYMWRIDVKPPMYGHNELIESLEKAVKKHPRTVFIACHLANLDFDLTRLGGMLDRNPNLYADISARFGETAPIPRFVNNFLKKYSDRVLYGTDMAYNQLMFSTTFRILESNDEHFYAQGLYFNFRYHWPLYGFGLPDDILKKVYRENAMRAFRQAQEAAGT